MLPAVIDSSLQYIPASKMVIGFESGLQAYTGVSGGVEHEKAMIATSTERSAASCSGRQRGRARAERQDDGRPGRARELRRGALTRLPSLRRANGGHAFFPLLFSPPFSLPRTNAAHHRLPACPAPSSAGPCRAAAHLRGLLRRLDVVHPAFTISRPTSSRSGRSDQVIVREERALSFLRSDLVPAPLVLPSSVPKMAARWRRGALRLERAVLFAASSGRSRRRARAVALGRAGGTQRSMIYLARRLQSKQICSRSPQLFCSRLGERSKYRAARAARCP